MDSLRGTALGSSSFFHQLSPCLFLHQKLWGLTFLALEPLLGGLVWGWDSLLLRYLFRIFIHPAFLVFSPPPRLDGCGFFNAVVVRLPFSLISVGSEQWLFYILLVILLWLCEEASRVSTYTFLFSPFTESFNNKWVLDSTERFFCIYGYDHVIFVFLFSLCDSSHLVI